MRRTELELCHGEKGYHEMERFALDFPADCPGEAFHFYFSFSRHAIYIVERTSEVISLLFCLFRCLLARATTSGLGSSLRLRLLGGLCALLASALGSTLARTFGRLLGRVLDFFLQLVDLVVELTVLRLEFFDASLQARSLFALQFDFVALVADGRPRSTPGRAGARD